MSEYIKAGRDGRFWYGIPEIYFIWNGEWNDPEIAYGGLVFSTFSIGIEEMYRDELAEDLGREPTDDEFADYMRDNGENIKHMLAYECMPVGVEAGIVDELDLSSSIPGAYDLNDAKEVIDELRELTIIRGNIWDKVYQVFVNIVGTDFRISDDELTDKMNAASIAAQERLIDEVVNPENYYWV